MRFTKNNQSRAAREAGFSLIEVLISTFVLTIGLLSLLGVLGLAVSATMSSEEDGIAKEMAQDAYESIYTARDTANVQWSNIDNVSGAGPGIFLTGLQPIYKSGADGIIGTADDSIAGAQTLTLPGPDGISGTSDDIIVPLTNFRRQIAIIDTATNLKTVNVTIQYTTPRSKLPKQYVLSGFISQYR
jgi:type II secretory pathway pseudopilin PulG